MTEIDLGKTLKIEANGDIKIENLIKIEAGAVYADGGNFTVNVYGKEPMKETSEGQQDAVPSQEVAAGVEGLTAEDEERLLPVFNQDKAQIYQFLAECKGILPTQITAKVNVWISDGRIYKIQNMKKLWSILHNLGIYKPSYQAWNKQVK